MELKIRLSKLVSEASKSLLTPSNPDIKPGAVIKTPKGSYKIVKADKPSHEHEGLYETLDTHELTTGYMNDPPNMTVGEIRPIWSDEKGKFLGYIDYYETSVRVVFPDVDINNVSNKQLNYINLIEFISGDQKLYARWAKEQARYQSINLNDPSVTIIPSQEIPRAAYAGIEQFKKSDLICYLVAVFGPMPKDMILKGVSRLEGKPHISTSNASYFAPTNSYGMASQSVIVKGLMKPISKAGKKLVYQCTTKGMAVAAKVVGVLGEQPAKDALAAD
jgi:hypothetical protein